MPAPTAWRQEPDAEMLEAPQNIPLPDGGDHDLLISTDLSTAVSKTTPAAPESSSTPTTITPSQSAPTDPTTLSTASTPLFPPAKPSTHSQRSQTRKIPIPPHRMSPLKNAWPKIYPPLVEHLHLQVRMNLAAKSVELRNPTRPPPSTKTTTSSHSSSTSTTLTHGAALQKGVDFIHAFTLGFDVDDAIALLRLDDLFIETFEIKDVKTLGGEHLGRAIGRIAGKDGRTKFGIENATRTRIVLADSKVHILGGFKEIRIAREAVVSLILGKPVGKVQGGLRGVVGRMKERF